MEEIRYKEYIYIENEYSKPKIVIDLTEENGEDEEESRIQRFNEEKDDARNVIRIYNEDNESEEESEDESEDENKMASPLIYNPLTNIYKLIYNLNP